MDINERQEILVSGGMLYGDTSNDVSHIELAVGAAIDTIKRLYDGKQAVSVLLELGINENGLFVSYPLNGATEENMLN